MASKASKASALVTTTTGALQQFRNVRTENPQDYKIFAKPEVMNFQIILSKIDYESKVAATEFLILLNAIAFNIVTVESLTAGKIASTLADIPSYANCIYGGFVVYDSDAKREFLDVTVKSVYNQKCAKQMAEGALKKSRAMCALAVTGQAGGYDDTDEIYLGYVDVALSIRKTIDTFNTYTKRIKFCEDKYISPICAEYKKRLNILHTRKACPDLSNGPSFPPLSDNLYQIRQIIRTACVRDAIIFAHQTLTSHKINTKHTTKLDKNIFPMLTRDRELRFCGEPSAFIKKYMIGDLTPLFNENQWPKLFGKSDDDPEHISGTAYDDTYNDFCDQKDWYPVPRLKHTNKNGKNSKNSKNGTQKNTSNVSTTSV